jgi:hypothetical protein
MTGIEPAFSAWEVDSLRPRGSWRFQPGGKGRDDRQLNAGAIKRRTIWFSTSLSPIGQTASDMTTRTIHWAACGSSSVMPVRSAATA